MTNNKAFLSLAKQLQPSYVEKENEQCPDNYVGTFTKKNNGEIKSDLWFTKQARTNHQDKISLTSERLNLIKQSGKPVMLVILESPHAEEFNQTYEISPSPALGVTGDMMSKHFIDIISPYVEDDTYHVILVNAIQYQCSLGVDTNIYRDRIWLNLWLCHGLKDVFQAKLVQYNPDVIINLCTRGSHQKDPLAPVGAKTVINQKYIDDVLGMSSNKCSYTLSHNTTTLKELTQLAIESSGLSDKHLLEGPHPSSWYSQRNRRMAKV